MTKKQLAGIKRAAMDFLKARADRRNNGASSMYKMSTANHDLLYREDVRISDKEVTAGGTVLFTIQRRFGKRKVSGCYPELSPILVPAGE